MKSLFYSIVALSIILVSACDVINNPIQSPEVPVDTGAAAKQNVLIEDYTGHTCGNCPEAAEIAHQIQTTYGDDRVIVVAVHAGPFANPQPPDYVTDFRSAEGTEMDNYFKISRAGNPNGLVNRVKYSGKLIQSKDNWAPATAELLAKSPAIKLTMDHTWDSTTKTVDVNVDIKYLQDGTTDYNLVGWLIESNIIDDQTDYRQTPSHIPDYVFNHVLRASFSGTWGEQISTTAVSAGQTLHKTLHYTFPASATWDPHNCEIVVYVHRYGVDDKDVIQIIKTKLIAN